MTRYFASTESFAVGTLLGWITVLDSACFVNYKVFNHHMFRFSGLHKG